MLGQDLQSIVVQMLRAVGDVKEVVSLHVHVFRRQCVPFHIQSK